MTAATAPTHYYIANILRDHMLRQSELAVFIQDQTGVSINPSSFNKYILGKRPNHKYEANLSAITTAIAAFLRTNKVSEDCIKQMWQPGKPYQDNYTTQVTKEAIRKRVERATKKTQDQQQQQRNNTIQPEPEMLSSKALAHFKLHRDPFINEISSAADLFLHQQQRFAREQMLHAVRNATMLALIAESGAGKSQVRKSFFHAVSQSDEHIRIIEPEVIDKADMTPEMIMHAIADELQIKGVPHGKEKQARFIKKHLQTLVGQGFKFALVIEEAHDLPDKVLKFLKRTWEWDDGFKKLIAIILIGQNELKGKLSETQIHVREFSRRCHQVELYPLADSMGEYLSHKFERAGQSIDKIITPAAITHLRQKLLREESWGQHRPADIKDHSYPLTVNAWVSNAINRCVALGEPMVTPAIIDKVNEGF